MPGLAPELGWGSCSDTVRLPRGRSGALRPPSTEPYGYLYRRAGQNGAELLGEVFLVALRRLTDLPAPELRRAWLFGTARRLLLAQQRKGRQRTGAEEQFARVHDPSPALRYLVATSAPDAVFHG